jgi:hypothetical protein
MPTPKGHEFRDNPINETPHATPEDLDNGLAPKPTTEFVEFWV